MNEPLLIVVTVGTLMVNGCGGMSDTQQRTLTGVAGGAAAGAIIGAIAGAAGLAG